MAIWRDLVDDHGFPAQYASVRRFVLTLRGARPAEAHPVIVTAPGEEGQVDYGDGPMVRHPVTRKYRRTRLFVFTLGYSRKSVRLLTFESSTRRWAELHEETFRRLGGAVRVVVLDNLREGVLTPDIYDPTLNPLYRDVLAHYGAVALPCRVGDPDRKGKVESAIDHTQAAPSRACASSTLDEAQAYLDRWDVRWADTRIHGTTKRQVAAMFAEERPALLPLPVEPFRYYQFGTRTVHLDGCVEVDVRLLRPAAGLARPRGRGPMGWGARPPPRSHHRHAPPRAPPAGARASCDPPRGSAGPHAPHHAHAARRAPSARARMSARSARPSIVATARPGCAASSGSSRWSRSTAPPRSRTPAPRPWSSSVADYRFVRRYLERQPAAPLTLRQVDPLIRDLTHYRDVIARKTQEEIPT